MEKRRFHRLKTTPEYFRQILLQEKKFELRSTLDRDFQVGDYLLIEEYSTEKAERTGDEMLVLVTSLLKGYDGIKEDYVIMSIELRDDKNFVFVADHEENQADLIHINDVVHIGKKKSLCEVQWRNFCCNSLVYADDLRLVGVTVAQYALDNLWEVYPTKLEQSI